MPSCDACGSTVRAPDHKEIGEWINEKLSDQEEELKDCRKKLIKANKEVALLKKENETLRSAVKIVGKKGK